jgi:hypothetical protein
MSVTLLFDEKDKRATIDPTKRKTPPNPPFGFYFDVRRFPPYTCVPTY